MAPLNFQNPLEYSNLPHHAIPFDQIDPDQFLPSLKTSLERAKVEIAKVRDNPEKPTFANTLVALETAGEATDLVAATFYNLLHAHTNPKLQALAEQIGPVLANHSSDILLDPKLFARIRDLYERRAQLKLNVEESQLLEKYYLDFVRNGSQLGDREKEELRAIDNDLSKLGPQFSENVLKATNEYFLHITNQVELDGLPQMLRDGAAQAAKDRGLEGWVFTLQMPSYLPFMQYATHRPAREKMQRAFSSRAFGGAHDNQKLILRILELKQKRARLLGYKNYADFTLERRMAKSAPQVFEFLNRLEKASVTAAKKDIAEIEQFARAKGAPLPLQAWDFSFWAERLKEEKFKFSQEDLRPYFQLENVVAGVFEHARRLYGLKFVESKNYPVWHPDVRAFEVQDEASGEFIGLFYTDFFPRETKNGGAWMTNYYDQGLYHGQVDRPHVAICCNFTKPTANQPSLLTYDEVSTLFHEFGHSLHSLLSKCNYRSLSGTNVFWDFVELPSQIMENWIEEQESLDLFAKHYQTGAKIPQELVKKIKDSARYLAGYQSLRQVTFALLDMAWYTVDPQTVKSVDQFEDQAIGRLRVLPKIDGANTSCSFSHIFAGGYGAGYYSYKWAEVLDADAFEFFKERGLFNREVASRFRDNVLSRGGTEHPMELYKRFRGREPDPDALLRRDGLL